ncbi:MAG TPA: hypothetical protein VLA20_09400, partial [Vicinamibacterales bacterium]|nr:hypothetical protein [Vicinamibacterales bacterium]
MSGWMRSSKSVGLLVVVVVAAALFEFVPVKATPQAPVATFRGVGVVCSGSVNGSGDYVGCRSTVQDATRVGTTVYAVGQS